MLCSCGEVVRRSHLAPLPLMRRPALLLLLFVRICPVGEAAVSRFIADFAVELGEGVVHAREALVFRSLCALEHYQLLVECGEHICDEHAEAKEELALLDGGLLVGREIAGVLREEL
jgi:hypothetical protein